MTIYGYTKQKRRTEDLFHQMLRRDYSERRPSWILVKNIIHCRFINIWKQVRFFLILQIDKPLFRSLNMWNFISAVAKAFALL